MARGVETWLEHLGVATGGKQSLLEEIRSEVAVRSSEQFAKNPPQEYAYHTARIQNELIIQSLTPVNR